MSGNLLQPADGHMHRRHAGGRGSAMVLRRGIKLTDRGRPGRTRVFTPVQPALMGVHRLACGPGSVSEPPAGSALLQPRPEGEVYA